MIQENPEVEPPDLARTKTPAFCTLYHGPSINGNPTFKAQRRDLYIDRQALVIRFQGRTSHLEEVWGPVSTELGAQETFLGAYAPGLGISIGLGDLLSLDEFRVEPNQEDHMRRMATLREKWNTYKPLCRS